MAVSLSAEENASLHLCGVLDTLGYSQRMIQFRRDAYQDSDIGPRMRLVTSGSKGEGLVKPFESDHDQLILDQNVICTEGDLVDCVTADVSVFTFSPEYPFPGYNLLTHHHRGRLVHESVSLSFIPGPMGKPLLSSEKYAKANIKWHKYNKSPGECVDDCIGAATSTSIGKYDIDKVYSLPSISPTILLDWYQRPRQHEWPPLDLRQRILQMKGNFVTKGCKDSPMQRHEWRQCFNEAELLLVHSWNGTLTKLYALLKTINKEVLRPFDRKQAISSYTMKNIVFWLAERNPVDRFQEKYLLKLLMKSLHMLRHSLDELFLPYYMIPGRNLLSDMPERMRETLLHRADNLIREGPLFLTRCEKLANTAAMSYADLADYCARRDELEMIFLRLYIRTDKSSQQFRSTKEVYSDQYSVLLITRMFLLISSKWPPNLEEKLEDCADCYSRLETILSY